MSLHSTSGRTGELSQKNEDRWAEDISHDDAHMNTQDDILKKHHFFFKKNDKIIILIQM